MRSLGADEVIDYEKEGFSRGGRKSDFILDVTLRRSTFTQRRTLARGGRYATIGGATGKLLETFVLGSIMNLVGSKSTGNVMQKVNRADLDHLADLVDGGELSPAIDAVYPLEEGVEAFRRYGTGLFTGNIVITLA